MSDYLPSTSEIRRKALSAFDTMRQSLADSGIQQMSLKEINTEIKAARDERKEKD